MTTNLHQQILNEFLNSNIKIKSLDRLNEYISYCISNNQNKHTKFKTSHHHILPKADDCFPRFKNLKVNKWNGTYLKHSDHYYAHWLLTEALNSSSQLFAFCAMHNKDLKLGRINKSDLIPAEVFQEKMEERSTMYLQWCVENPEKVQEMLYKQKLTKEKNNSNILGGQKCSATKQSQEWKDSIGKEAIEKHKITKSSQEWKDSIGKEAIEKHNTTINSQEWKESIGKEQILKYKETVNSQEWKDSIGKEKSDKISKKRQDTEWKESIGKEAIEKMVLTKQTKEYKETNGINFRINIALTYKLKSIKKFGLFNVMYNDKIIFSNLCKSEICKISPSLFNATKDAKIGNTNVAKSKLNTYKRLHLIGYYVVKINI